MKKSKFKSKILIYYHGKTKGGSKTRIKLCIGMGFFLYMIMISVNNVYKHK